MLSVMSSCGVKPDSKSTYHKIVRSIKQKKRLGNRKPGKIPIGQGSMLYTGTGNWNKISFGNNRDRK